MAVHAVEHGAVGHAGRGKHRIAAGEVVEFVLAPEIRDAETRRTCALVIVAEDQPRLDLTADTTQRRRAYLRFYACEQDFSNEPPDTLLPDKIATGEEPLLIIGAIAGG